MLTNEHRELIRDTIHEAFEARPPCPCSALTDEQAKVLGPLTEAFMEELEIKRYRREAWQKVRAFGPAVILVALPVWALLWALFGSREGTDKFIGWISHFVRL